MPSKNEFLFFYDLLHFTHNNKKNWVFLKKIFMLVLPSWITGYSSKKIWFSLKNCGFYKVKCSLLYIPEVGGDEILEDGPKTEDDHQLHPKLKLKITKDGRPKISYICILRLQIQRNEKWLYILKSTIWIFFKIIKLQLDENENESSKKIQTISQKKNKRWEERERDLICILLWLI